MTFDIREVTPANYAAVVQLRNVMWPTRPGTAEALAKAVERTRAHPLGLHFAQWLAWQGGQAVGFTLAKQWAGWYHPNRYSVTVEVLPEFRGRGVGNALAQHLQAYLQARGAQELHAGAHENDPAALHFLEGYGFSEISREFQSSLEVSAFKAEAWAAQAALPEGFRCLNWTEWLAECGAEVALRTLLPCFNEARLDEPTGADVSAYSVADLQRDMTSPALFPPGFLLAVSPAGEVAAFSSLWLDASNPKRLNTGLTGTARAYRRQGLARTLKLAAIRVAAQHGVTELWTDNDSRNAGMLAINRALGFQAQPAYIAMQWGKV